MNPSLSFFSLPVSREFSFPSGGTLYGFSPPSPEVMACRDRKRKGEGNQK